MVVGWSDGADAVLRTNRALAVLVSRVSDGGGVCYIGWSDGADAGVEPGSRGRGRNVAVLRTNRALAVLVSRVVWWCARLVRRR